MVRSLNEIVYDILEQYRANLKVTDSLDKRQVASWIQHYRAELIKQRLEEPMRTINEHWVQDLKDIELVPIDTSLVSGIRSDRYIVKSVREIPSTIQCRDNVGTFTRIASADLLEHKFNIVSYERALYSGNGKFNKKDIYVFIHNKHLYLMSKTQLHKYLNFIHVKGVFQNPIEAYEFTNGVGSYNWDMEYPVDEHLVSALKSFIKYKELQFKSLPLEDDIQDGKDTLVNTNVRK